jgi:hypothetical protein
MVQHSLSRAQALLKEANIDFTRTMNKVRSRRALCTHRCACFDLCVYGQIIFDLHLEHARAEGLMPLVTNLPKRCGGGGVLLGVVSCAVPCRAVTCIGVPVLVGIVVLLVALVVLVVVVLVVVDIDVV